ncbi:hypothetical protein B0T22DRAFT_512503 [Podospora appendiculata]|uniref:Uncharacterized protein n=1 Tax=Podospora appendiculata TaxID=314037 RepID=A0AAE0XAJ6_9PEZI|nr:hypothetical protein B0T22DRAFT_512503 [Podospora appendiculata]
MSPIVSVVIRSDLVEGETSSPVLGWPSTPRLPGWTCPAPPRLKMRLVGPRSLDPLDLSGFRNLFVFRSHDFKARPSPFFSVLPSTQFQHTSSRRNAFPGLFFLQHWPSSGSSGGVSMAEDNLGWVLEPGGRGTFGLLKSCILTLLLCVYTAIHLNIPATKDTKRRLYLRKTKWLVIAMLAPELVVYIAWCQRQEVKKLHKMVAKSFEQLGRRDSTKKRAHSWTTTHSWYAYMGGFAIDTTPTDSADEFITGSPPLRLFSQGVTIMGESGQLPDIPLRYVQDKSKADSLAKLLIISQSSWMVLQCITRRSAGLYVTMVELNTLAHAVCALIIYALWWEKPKDIQDPTLLAGDSYRTAAIAYWSCNMNMSARSDASSAEYPRLDIHVDRARHDRTELDNLASVDLSSLPADGGDISNNQVQAEDSEDCLIVGNSTPAKDPPIDQVRVFDILTQEYSARAILGIRLRWTSPDSPSVGMRSSFCPIPGGEERLGKRMPDTTKLVIDRPCLTRWSILWTAWLHGGGDARSAPIGVFSSTKNNSGSRFEANLTGRGIRFEEWATKHHNYFDHSSAWGPFAPFIVGRVENWKYVDPDDEGGGASLAIFLILALAYGGIHATAWNDEFSSLAEKMLWRASCAYMAAYSVVCSES